MTLLPPPNPPAAPGNPTGFTNPPSSGGSSTPASRYLRPWHVISQMTTWAPTSQLQADRSMECGQACMVMALKYLTGVWTSAAYLDTLVHDPSVVQGTTLDQMISTLSMNATKATIVEPASMADVRAAIEGELGVLGHPLIVLRYWDHPGNSLLHYACITGYDQSSIEIAGPGYGKMFTEPDNQFWSMYAGALVLIHRKRMLGDH